jgi:hypothetical protein
MPLHLGDYMPTSVSTDPPACGMIDIFLLYHHYSILLFAEIRPVSAPAQQLAHNTKGRPPIHNISLYS